MLAELDQCSGVQSDNQRADPSVEERLVAIWLIKVLVLLRLHLVLCARFAQIIVAVLAGKNVPSIRVANITVDVWIIRSF